jgi:hypothetical protein
MGPSVDWVCEWRRRRAFRPIDGILHALRAC